MKSEYIKDQLPFSSNYDLFNSISFSKGCYQGQEVVSRAFHTGVFKLFQVVRKRILPFLVNPDQNFKEMGNYYLKVFGLDENMID